MNIVKRIIYGLSVALLSSLAFVGILATTASIDFTDREKVKSWPIEAGTYEAFTDGILNVVEQESNGQIESLKTVVERSALNQEAIFAATDSVFTPEYWQGKYEPVIDSVYDWLDGTTSDLNFSVSFSDKSQEAATALEQSLATQLNLIPACSFEEIPQSFDALGAVCLPPGISPAMAASQFKEELLSEDSFVNSIKLTDEDFNLSDNILQNAPGYYTHLKNVPFYFLLTVVFLCGIILLSAKQPIRGLRRIGHSLSSAGLLSWIGFFITGKVFQGGISIEGEGSVQQLAREVVLPLSKTVVDSVANTGMWVSIVVLIVGILTWLAAFYWHKIHHHHEAEQIAKRSMASQQKKLPAPVNPDPIPPAEPETPAISVEEQVIQDEEELIK
jgi:hypothetical protein